ncbi:MULTISPECIES: hypothetical protein [unclassified Lactobacillus]|uniref:hypothetical protein n=1 Tax=unclassified Lactobacillus TaxID=2620435 RepID=UPI000EFD4035|nr:MULTISPECIES: hypothetical protein [unclassified Lactobacillus]RMC23704.1 hypothetical protein F5ESL0247_07065 [Lactobacillus sp. ESL0247]RMC27464.1 hypothetical protein F5ESL0246_07065 [Lactobacillus sp. ESL0246]RMC30665.1 hypothetical protein F5ESL0245_07065 [Lactobacillus sp. ESL0245]RMC47244.1 hypothetical protein F5ESL0228_07265 [Lactobacillus sp. ESL0228]
MHKQRVFPIVYGIISSLIAFIAVFFISNRTFKWSLPIAVMVASIFAMFFFVLSWFRGHASVEIKRIAHEFQLSDEDLAQITGMKRSDFPIYHDRLQLILPKRYWPKVLTALQKFERDQK